MKRGISNSKLLQLRAIGQNFESVLNDPASDGPITGSREEASSWVSKFLWNDASSILQSAIENVNKQKSASESSLMVNFENYLSVVQQVSCL